MGLIHERNNPMTDDLIDDVLGDWTPPAVGVDEHTARAQTRRAVEWLRESDAAHGRTGFIDELADGSTLDPATWWTRAVRPGLDRFDAVGVVAKRADGSYRWVGDAARDGQKRRRA